MNTADSRPTISVIIPVYNGARFLRAAVESIRAQNPAPSQIVVVDDGSTDNTAEVARALGAGVEYVRQENAGQAAARNRALEHARGDYIGFLDVDDLWPPGRTAVLLEYLQQHPAVAAVLGRTEPLVENAGDRVVYSPGENADQYPPLFLLLGAGLFRRSVFGQVGGFDAAKRMGEDLDWFIRAREKQISIPSVTATSLIKRAHEENLTRGKTTAQLKLAAVLHASLLRRRQKDGIAHPLPDSPAS